MSDSEARFCRRLGLAVGRWDWWRLRNEHTPYEWAMQLHADKVDPIGPHRDDKRMAVAVYQMLRAMRPDLDTASLRQIGEFCEFYLRADVGDDSDKPLWPEEVEQLRAKRNGR